jgi:oligo-1,6-glucosidase
VYPSPQDDAGYDISDYRAIDPVFGTLVEFDALLAEVHARGMKLIMDLVVNHTSDEHPWFEESRADTDKRGWYWWRPPRPGTVGGTPGAEPNNWASFFSGPAWEWDEASGEYYLHLFSRKQPDLNWENPQVREAIYDMMRWWLDRGVDGFRMDVINLISKVVELPDGAPIDSGPLGDGTPFVMCGPRIHDFLHEMHEHVFVGRGDGLLTVGEMPGVTVEDARLFTDPARGEVDMVFQSSTSTSTMRRSSGVPSRCRCSTSRPPSDAGRAVCPRLAGTRCTGTTTTSHAPSPVSAATTPSTGNERPSSSLPSCTCTEGRPMCIRVKNSV